MSVILFVGDYVLQTGAQSYSRVVDVLPGDRVLLANGETCVADVHDVQNYMSAGEYAEYTMLPVFPQTHNQDLH